MINKYDIYLYKSYFEDDPNQYKVKPGVITDSGEIMIITKITGAEHGARTKYDYILKDWEEEGLSKPSIVRCNKEQLIDFVEVYDYVGHLSQRDQAGVESILHLTESIEQHDDLNSALWDNNELKPEVKDKLLEIVNYFIESLKEDGIAMDVKDIQIVGSNAGYNYTNNSDIDCHLMVDMSTLGEHEDLTAKLYDAYRRLWNSKYEPIINGHEVEIYVEPYEGE